MTNVLHTSGLNCVICAKHGGFTQPDCEGCELAAKDCARLFGVMFDNGPYIVEVTDTATRFFGGDGENELPPDAKDK